MNTRIFLFMSLLALPFPVFAADENANENWKKVRDDHGITIYVKNIPDSAKVKARAELAINANMELVKLVVEDMTKRKSWVPFLKESRVLKKISDTEQIEYSLFDAPWPASDRDFVYRQKIQNKNEDEIIYETELAQTELMPEVDGVVRAELIESKYTLTMINENQTYVEFVFYADPKGWVPNWVVNVIQKRLPYMMLSNLRKKVEALDAKRRAAKK